MPKTILCRNINVGLKYKTSSNKDEKKTGLQYYRGGENMRKERPNKTPESRQDLTSHAKLKSGITLKGSQET